MKIKKVAANMHKKVFEIGVGREVYDFPFSRAERQPSVADPIVELCVDNELGREAFTYRLRSGAEASVHIDQVLDYNRDPAYLKELMLYKLTLEAQQRIETCSLSKREIIRRLRTSPAQLYRLLDQTNYKKSIGQMLALLRLLGCEVELSFRTGMA